MKKIGDLLILSLVSLMLVSVIVVPAAGTVAISGDTQYDGVDGDNQAIEVETTVSPEGEEMVDATVTFRGTDQTFLDPDSFDVTISPGDAETDVSPAGDGRFEIDRVGPNEEVTFEFEVFPRTIKQESIDAASVQIEYTQSGQELEDSKVFTADLTSSSYFELENQPPLRSLIGILNIVGYVAIVVVIAGVVGFIARRMVGDDKKDAYS